MNKFNFEKYFCKTLEEHSKMISSMSSLVFTLESIAEQICKSLCNGGKLMVCGNGGSAADSQHLVAEFIGKFTIDRKPLAAHALTTDSSILTCIGNDYSFDAVFSRQVQALGKKDDCLLGISTSGNSLNVIKAIQSANEMGISTIGLLGSGGGKLASICDIALVVPNSETARIQEAHLLIEHMLCGAVEQQLSLVKEAE